MTAIDRLKRSLRRAEPCDICERAPATRIISSGDWLHHCCETCAPDLQEQIEIEARLARLATFDRAHHGRRWQDDTLRAVLDPRD